VRLRRRLLFPLVALLGAAVVVLPALAASSEAKLEVNENCVEANWPCWTSSSASKPSPTTVTTIAQGGAVTFVDNTSVAVSLTWTGAAPSCSAAVPVSPAPAKAGWEGTCTFETPGRYKLESTTLWPAYTKYEIVVQPPSGTTTTGPTGTTTTGTTTTGTTTTGTTTTGTSTTGASTTGSTSHGSSTPTYGSGGGSQARSGEPSGGGSAPGALLVGGAGAALKLDATQHGRSVRGSIDVAAGAAGGRIDVELLVPRASLARAARSKQVPVARFGRSSLHAGVLTFTVVLDAGARHALHVHGRLVVTVEILLSPAHGAPLRITRSVVLRG
jgi:hypothetical protein